MNILVISATYPPSVNGVAISTERSVNSLRSLGHNVYAVIPNTKKILKAESEENYYYLSSLPNPYISEYKLPIPIFSSKLKKWLKQKNIDIVHVHHPFGISTLAKKIAKFVNSPLVFTYHTRYGEYASLYAGDLAKHLVNKKVVNFCNNDCDGVIATTKNFQKKLSEILNTPIYYASVAGLVKSMKLAKSKMSLRKELDLPQKKNILLSVSRHSVEKNLSLLLEIMEKLDKKEFHLVMVGDGPYNSELKDMTKKMKLSKNISFIGFVNQDDLKKYYSSSDVFLFSSQTDTAGLNILEAMSAGLPVLAVDDLNTREVVENGINGYLLPNSAKEFTSHLELLFDKKSLLNKLKKNAKKTSQKFTIEETTKKLIKAYRKVITNF